MRTRAGCAWIAVAVFLAGGVRAEVVDLTVTGFEVRESVTIAAPAERVWAALGQIGAWWDKAHTFSGETANLAITLEPGGCWCETLTGRGAGVQHMRVIYVKPPFAARLEGALGPLQTTGAVGHMAWTIEEKASGALFTLTYDVGGYAKGGFASWAKPVDRVLGAQVQRLKRYVETAAP